MKNKVLWLFTLFSGFMLATQCKKESEYYASHVGGIIIGIHNWKPVPNTQAELVELTGLVGTPNSYKTLDSMKVGADGRYRFEFTAKKGIQYAIRAKHPQYRYVDYSVSYFSHGAQDQDTLSFALFPYVYLKVHIQDTTKTDTYKGVYFFALNSGDDVSIWSTRLDTTVILKHVYKPFWFSWQLKYANNRSGAEHQFEIPCNPLDTCNINVKF